MRAFSRWLGGLLSVCAWQACDANDQVLEPDPRHDAGLRRDAGSQVIDGGGGDLPADSGPDHEGDAGTSPIASDADCDFNGVWIGRQLTRSEALGDQFANNWYYLELAQAGEQVTVTRHFDCGIVVKGTVTVLLTPETTIALSEHNHQDGRKGTLRRDGESCAFEMERFWSVRGASEATFLPSGADVALDIPSLSAKNPLPESGSSAGQEDWDGDGKPGTAWQVTGIVSGTRHSVQRDWTEWFSDAEYPIAPSLDWPDDLLVRARFSNEENVLESTNPLLKTVSTPDATAKHTLTLRFLGRTRGDARVQEIVSDDVFETCMAIQAALPTKDGF